MINIFCSNFLSRKLERLLKAIFEGTDTATPSHLEIPFAQMRETTIFFTKPITLVQAQTTFFLLKILHIPFFCSNFVPAKV